MKIEDRQSQGGFQEVDPTNFFSLLRHAWPLDPPFQRRLMPFLPASTKRQAEEKMTFTCDVQWIPIPLRQGGKQEVDSEKFFPF